MISHAKLLHVCDYDPATGIFRWRNPPYHKSKAGQQMGRTLSDGYIQIKIENKVYYAAPLAWFYMTGKWATDTVDHKNRIRGDNRWKNLREATRVQQIGNTKKHAQNKSGYRGVSASKQLNAPWRASIKIQGTTANLGNYMGKEAAAIAYDIAADKHFGEFAMLNFPTAPSRDWILI